MKEFTVIEADAGARLDVFTAAQYPQFTRSSLQILFDKALIHVNGETAKPSYKIRTRDVITIDESLHKAKPPAIELPIIYEDDDVVVIDKPDGILTHAKGALNLEGTVASFIKPKLTDKKLIGNRAGIVHRLDRQTSGVIITAKNETALKWLQKQFSTRKVKKSYVAIIEGVLEPQKALIDAPIARNPNKPYTFTVRSGGKPSQTEYETLKIIDKNNQRYSLLRLTPYTGRTHQLRVHMAYVGHPIVGDAVYGKADNKEMLLHAQSLELILSNKTHREFTAPLPDKIRSFGG